MRPPRRGFTLIELLVVITILIIILGAIFVFVDPVRRFNMTRNAVRRADSEAIAKAVSLTLTDAQEEIPEAVNTLDRKWRMIGTQTNGCSIACGDLGTTIHALSFSNSGTFVTVPGSSLLDFDYDRPFTFSFWVRPHSIKDYSPFFYKSDTGNQKGYVIGQINGRVFMAFFPSLVADGAITTSVVLSNNRYTHIAISYNGNRINPAMQIYVDGVSSSLDVTLPAQPSSHFASHAPLVIGGYHTFVFPSLLLVAEVKGYFQGELDDLRAYNGVLQSTDILRIKNGGEHQDGAVKLLAHWMFDEGDGKETEDSSDNDASGSIAQDSMWSDTVAPLAVVNTQTGLRYELPSACMDLREALTTNGQLPKVPVNQATDTVEPTEAMTYYAIRSINGTISVRSCLSEGEERQGAGQGPSIEVSR